jgi:hypothetical protein
MQSAVLHRQHTGDCEQTMTAHLGSLRGLFGNRGGTKTDNNEQAAPDAEQKAASTTGGDIDQEPVVVWEAANNMEAQIVKGRLESEGIPAFIRGEALGTIFGLTSGSLAATDVLVPYALADQAIEILHSNPDSASEELWTEEFMPEEPMAEEPVAESENLNGEPHGTDQ